MRRVFPLSLIAGPFGLVYGATAADSGIADVPAIAASFVIQAGASQIALVELIADDASWVVAVATALVINLRFGLYSASVASAKRLIAARATLTFSRGSSISRVSNSMTSRARSRRRQPGNAL